MKDATFSSARLLSLYDRISDAPDAIPRLRRFVLDLAVRGKLVEQDAGDEPAAELLKRIANEKARLVKAGEIKASKPIPRVGEDELSFNLPDGWAVARLAEVAVCLDYMREPINGTEREKRIEGKAPEDLYPYFGATQQQGWIDEYIFNEDLILLGEDGIPFFDLLRSKAYLISGKTWVNNHAHVFRGILVSNRFLVHYLNVFDYSGRVVGATRAKLNQAQAVDIAVPLPPLAEQHRIVAKVEDLMALCDQLEQARAGREAVRDRLTTASLARLTAPDTDAETYPAHARFALQSLPTLTTRPDQIKTLRQTILNLAVRGKLVEQDPTDEPAAELLKRIAKERRNFRDTKGALASVDEERFPLPFGWVWTPFGNLVLASDAGWSPKTLDHPRQEGEWGVLKVSAVSWDYFDACANKQVTPGTQPRLQAQVRQGDFLISRANTAELIARAVLVQEEPDRLMMSDKIVRLRLAEHTCPRYLWAVNNYADFAREHYFSKATGVSPSMKNVSRHVILNLPIPFPPLAEQHRIVARVDALMALCDQLEASLTTATTTRRTLLDALLHEALGGETEAAA